MNDDEDEGDEEVEEKPDVDHLQVGGVRQAVIHLDISISNNICNSISISSSTIFSIGTSKFSFGVIIISIRTSRYQKKMKQYQTITHLDYQGCEHQHGCEIDAND